MFSATSVDIAVKPPSTTGLTPVVYILDDDVSVREAIEHVIADAGWHPQTFASAQEFLERPPAERPCCLILDVGLPDLNGLEVQERLASAHAAMPIIFITGRGDVRTTVRAMKAGATEFLTKPFEPETLTRAVETAVERSRALLEQKVVLEVVQGRHRTLTRRESEVMRLVVCGQLNKQVGVALGISEITVKAHRGRMMRKMKVKSLPELIRVAALLGLDNLMNQA